PRRVTRADLLCIGVTDVEVTIFAAIAGAAVAVVPVLEIVLVESNSFKMVPAKTGCRSVACVVFRLTDQAVIVGGAIPTTLPFPSNTGAPSLVVKMSRSPASALLSLKKSSVFHGRSRKA